MPAPVRAVVFDLGNVLVTVDWDRAIRRAAPLTPLAADAILPALVEHPVVRDYEEGRIDDETFSAAMVETLRLAIAPADFPPLWADMFERRPGMEALYAEAQARVPVAILSDTSPIHWRCIRALAPPLATPDALVVSYETGVHKPDPAAYRTACARLGTPPEACVFIDDRAENVAGAEAAGLQAFRYTNEPDTVARLRALLPAQSIREA